jgi:hypothetical protein
MHEIIVIHCADRTLNAFAAGTINYEGRWVCQQYSLILFYSITTVYSMDTSYIRHFS